jgi:hypothetical protein
MKNCRLRLFADTTFRLDTIDKRTVFCIQGSGVDYEGMEDIIARVDPGCGSILINRITDIPFKKIVNIKIAA